MSDTSIHLNARHGRLSTLMAAAAWLIRATQRTDGTPPPGTPPKFRDQATWNEVRDLPPHILRDIGFYD